MRLLKLKKMAGEYSARQDDNSRDTSGEILSELDALGVHMDMEPPLAGDDDLPREPEKLQEDIGNIEIPPIPFKDTEKHRKKPKPGQSPYIL